LSKEQSDTQARVSISDNSSSTFLYCSDCSGLHVI